MSDLIERISLIVPVISICFFMVITAINLYKKIRQKFPISVNCWFCNVNTKVPYCQFNSWTCGSCDQYNGFDADGDYNCDIPAQRSTQLNKRWKTGVHDERNNASTMSQPRNGLCETCNRNQEIKVQQLASFEPMVKENFDKEIVDFREKVEKSYELCYSCQRTVKRTLNRIMNNVLGLKLAQIGAKGLQVLDRHIKVAEVTKSNIINRICLTAIMLLSLWNLLNTSRTVNLTKTHLDSYFPPVVTRSLLMVTSYITAVKLVIYEYVSTSSFPTTLDWMMSCNAMTNVIDFITQTAAPIQFFNEVDFLINVAAVMLSVKLVFNNGVGFSSISMMMLWNVNMLWPRIERSVVNEFPGDLLRVSIAMLLVVVAMVNNIFIEEAPSPPKNQTPNNSFHRIYSSCDEDLYENSDDEEDACYSDSHNSTARSRNFDSSSILNNSFNTVKSTWKSSAKDLNQTFGKEFQHSPCCYQQSNPDFFDQRNNTSNRSFYSPYEGGVAKSKLCSSSLLNLNSSFRIPDDCQNKLTDLNISGVSRRNNPITCSSPTPSIVSLSRCRSQLLTPARLNINSHSPSLIAPVTKTSWVAGGFFVKNNVSPQKRQQSSGDLLHPLLSRTSSQSSGFESHSSSAHNGNGSRESSIAGDILSNFSEPTLIADSASQIGDHDFNAKSLFGVTTLSRPKPIFPLSTEHQSTPPIDPRSRQSGSVYDNYLFPLKGQQTFSDDWTGHVSQPVYHQFGTHRQSNSLFRNQFLPSRSIRNENLVRRDSYFFNGN